MNRLAPVVVALAIACAPARSQEATVTPPDNLVTQGIPPVPLRIAEDVGRYTEFRGASLESWNPTKREMLISTRFGDTPQLHYVTTPGGARTQLTFFPDRVVSGFFPPVSDEYFIIMKDVKGGEWYQLYRFDRTWGEIVLLTDGKSPQLPGPVVEVRRPTRRMFDQKKWKDIDFYITDPLKPGTDRMLVQLDRGEAWRAVDWSRDDKTILAIERPSITQASLWLIDAATGAKSELTDADTGEVAYGGGAFTPDGKEVLTVTDQGHEFLRLTLIDIASKKHTTLTPHIPWDVSSFTLSDDGKTIAFVTNENGLGVLHLMDAATRKELPAPKLPVGLIGSLGWHKDNTHLGFTITSARSATDVYSFNVTTGRVERWTMSETGGIDPSNFSLPELIEWKSFDGRAISGFLYRPASKFTGKRPVIVNIHGGPESQYRPGFLARNNYYLNELGVAMVFPNIRGSSGFGKGFLKLDNGYLREDTYKDIDALLDWIKKQPDLDGDKIMVTGGSYGGHMTLAVSTWYADKIRCAVDIVGPSNLRTFLENTEAYRRDLRRVEYGDERDPKMREFLERTAPLNNAEKITKPLFVIQGKNDPRVPASESEQIVATLKSHNTPVWYLLANDEGHGFAKKKNADFQFFATVLFMRDFSSMNRA